MLGRRGWNITLTARGLSGLDCVAAELAELGVQARSVAGDVADEAHIARLLADHLAAYGGLDALVLAAGVGWAGPIDGYSSKRLDLQLNVNFRSPFLLTSAALPSMRDSANYHTQGVSRLIAISSIEGLNAEPGLAAYGATKAALISLVDSVNSEERINGIVATAIAPGYVATDMSDWVTEVIAKDTMLSVDDVVRCVELVFDLSPQAVLPRIVLQRRTAGSQSA